MAIAIQINNIDATANGDLYVEGVLVPSGSYPSGGDAVDFSGVNSTLSLGAYFSGSARDITSTTLKQLWVGSQGGNILRQYVPTLPSGLASKMKVSQSGSFGNEQGAGAYPADVLADTIAFQATFKKNA